MARSDWALRSRHHCRQSHDVRTKPERLRMLGMPFGAGTAHIVQLGPVGVEQGLDQVAGEVGKFAHRSASKSAFDQFSFKDDRYRTDVAAVGKVYRRYRVAPRALALSLPFTRPAIQTIQTPRGRDTSPIQAAGSSALGVAHAESDVPGPRQAVTSQVFTPQAFRADVAEGGQNRAQAHRDGGPPGGRARALSARARGNEPEHVRLGYRKERHLYLSPDARGRGLRPSSALLAEKLGRFHPSR